MSTPAPTPAPVEPSAAAVERGWGIFEMDVSDVSTTRCVAFMLLGGGFTDWFPGGFLTWDTEHGTIEGVFVNEEFRGKGIATVLLAVASEIHGSPIGDSGEYTAEGYAWAKKRGIDPKMRTRISKADMNRMRARLVNVLWGAKHRAIAEHQEPTTTEE